MCLGGYGYVFVAQDTQSGKEYALKVHTHIRTIYCICMHEWYIIWCNTHACVVRYVGCVYYCIHILYWEAVDYGVGFSAHQMVRD